MSLPPELDPYARWLADCGVITVMVSYSQSVWRVWACPVRRFPELGLGPSMELEISELKSLFPACSKALGLQNKLENQSVPHESVEKGGLPLMKADQTVAVMNASIKHRSLAEHEDWSTKMLMTMSVGGAYLLLRQHGADRHRQGRDPRPLKWLVESDFWLKDPLLYSRMMVVAEATSASVLVGRIASSGDLRVPEMVHTLSEWWSVATSRQKLRLLIPSSSSIRDEDAGFLRAMEIVKRFPHPFRDGTSGYEIPAASQDAGGST